MPRFLLDENVPISLRDALKAKGFQAILAVQTLGAGVKNHDIAELAKRSNDIIVTFDEDFLLLKPETKAAVKVIYIKTHPRDPRKAQRLLDRWIGKCLTMLEKANAVILTDDGPNVQER